VNGITTDTETLAANAFNKQAALFDTLYGSDSMIRYKRQRVRDHLALNLKAQSHVLELNAGTGEDAIYLAEQGHLVHATDISENMLSILAKKAAMSPSLQISQEHCAFTDLVQLKQKGPYDLIFSNFAGLNCTGNLDHVLNSLSPLLKEQGVVTLVILPKFCLWEFLLLFKGKIKTALRRFAGRKGSRAHIEGEFFTCWYYNPSYVIKTLHKDFELLRLEGLCTFVPPSYIEGFPEKHPKLFAFLARIEDKLKTSWPWRSIGDYYIISLRKI
jgi:ubiquinone/menaquinone biosynthesis C-methylase UbiE